VNEKRENSERHKMNIQRYETPKSHTDGNYFARWLDGLTVDR
jgi:hypothetical protein